MSDVGVAALARMLTALTSLNLERTAVTDDGVMMLVSLTDLTWLNLSNCVDLVTDTGVAALAPLTALREITVIGCPGVTSAVLCC